MKWMLLEPGDKFQAGDQFFQYGQYPPDWRDIDPACFGLVVLPLTTGSFPTVHRRPARAILPLVTSAPAEEQHVFVPTDGPAEPDSICIKCFKRFSDDVHVRHGNGNLYDPRLGPLSPPKPPTPREHG